MATANEIPPNQHLIVREHADSSQALNELFNFVTGKSDPSDSTPKSKPLRDRNLPQSFFVPPPTGTRSTSHSRESSIDQQSKQPYIKQIIDLNKQQPQHQQKLALLNRAGIPIAHSRAHSSPATLQKTLSVVPQQLNNQNNQINQTAIQQPVIQNGVQQTLVQQKPEINTAIQHIRQLSDINQIPLPEGWEQALDQSTNRVYFINHNAKTTTWNDPRLEIQQQQLKQLQILQLEQHKLELQNQQQQIRAQLQQQQFQGQIVQQPQFNQQQQQIIIETQQQSINNNIQITNTKLPDGWEQRKTEDNVIYFIDHINQITTWFDPRIPIQLQTEKPNQVNRSPPEMQQVILQQQQQQQQVQSQQHTTSEIIQPQLANQAQSNQIIIQQQIPNGQQANNLVQQPQNIQNIPNDCKMRVQKLELEREKMRQRQWEIKNQRLFTQTVVAQQDNETTNNNNITNPSVDPFLGATTTGENHSRQESADSGLGSTYSLPNTPEDMLDSDVDLNDCGNYVHEDLGLESLAISAMDLDENMESDDLLPNLPESINYPDIHLSDIDALLAGNSNNSRDHWM